MNWLRANDYDAVVTSQDALAVELRDL